MAGGMMTSAHSIVRDAFCATSPALTARVEPIGGEILVDEGENLLHAALRQGYSWPNVCGGFASCTTCFVRVLAGIQSLSPPTDDERDAFRCFRGIDVSERPDLRLACQLLLHGDIVVRKLGVSRHRS